MKKIILGITIAVVICALGAGYMMLPKEMRRLSHRTIDGLDVRDYEKDDLRDILVEKYAWDFRIQGDDFDIAIDDAITPVIDQLIDDGYSMKRGFQYDVELSDEDIDKIVDEAVSAASEYEISADDNQGLIEYDADNDAFVFSDKVCSKTLKADDLESAVRDALNNKEYSAHINADFDVSETEVSGQDYEIIGQFETTTTANSNRNNNITIACETINGTILAPGETFDYNETLGERNAAKGYLEAGAYLNGEHVQQYGGGICQVSSTIYNAIFAANMQVDERNGHTFEPTYVRPGLDATVSYPSPDFKFTNSSDYPIGLAVHYADRHVNVEVYGVPTLEEGVIRYMTSEKTATLDPPAYTFEDNVTLQYNQQIVVQEPKNGSKWATYEVLEKDGEVISKEYIYSTVYKGEAGVIQRNLTLDQMVANINATQAATQSAQ